MSPVKFHIESRWRVKGTADQVYNIISKPQDFTRWWSSVYLDVNEIEHGDSNHIGRIVNLHTKGLLPYTLTWQAKTIEIDKPKRIVIEAQGDLQGKGIWELNQDGEWVNIDYDWTVVANRPWMVYLSLLLKPIFVANHRWAMRKGVQGLELELARRAHNNSATSD